ncbi:dolichyl-phosphate-mannose--protein mannosyltransferase [Actinocorallia populi]|uniref:dolichyl-phosphate-mannose--protein mannosyltransferase n=1 Tax=Actinocorallia populi TaxID=2079200 RepID=UPI001E4FFDFA|nr:phospholipid carrier-dependent glycosyltransferase [Actinocorallia populi]
MAVTETEPAPAPPTLRERLAPRVPGSALWGWLGPLLVTVFAGFLRFDRLGVPHAVVFDETYYAKDAYALLRFGYEHSWVREPEHLADELFLEGKADQIWEGGGSFIAHPPFGKWMIAIGEYFFQVTPFGWRFMAAVAGTLSVLILCRVARRMTGSTLLGCAAGLLLALDGLHLVTSRTALLDVFLMFWILAGFACLVADRDRSRRVLAVKLDADPSRGFSLGPWLGHPWRVLAGLCFGLACGTKWSAAPFLAVFVLMVVLWDVGARRAARVQFPVGGALAKDGAATLLSLGVLPVVTYVATWSGWLFTSGGWGRGTPAKNVLLRPFEGLPDLVRYHREILEFHNGLTSKHPYQSWPWDWPVLRRPVAFFYSEPPTGCSADKCSREILGIGTPALWWAALAALVVIAFLWLVYRDWRAGAVLAAYVAGWAAWLPSAFGGRTMFMFYALPLTPFMVLGVVLVLGLIIGPERSHPRSRRAVGSAIAGAYVLLVLLNFWYLYPVLTAQTIPYDTWHSRMWLDSWILGDPNWSQEPSSSGS